MDLMIHMMNSSICQIPIVVNHWVHLEGYFQLLLETEACLHTFHLQCDFKGLSWVVLLLVGHHLSTIIHSTTIILVHLV